MLGFKCQKAETTKYGRTWTAWFTTDILFQYVNHKLNGLPGLITELYDSKDDYHYTIYSFRKRKYTCKSANIATNAKENKQKKNLGASKKIRLLAECRFMKKSL
ncbi:GLPGLI family protein [Chryseobacterium wanjuense]